MFYIVLNDESKKIIPLDFSKKIILSLMKTRKYQIENASTQKYLKTTTKEEEEKKSLSQLRE